MNRKEQSADFDIDHAPKNWGHGQCQSWQVEQEHKKGRFLKC